MIRPLIDLLLPPHCLHCLSEGVESGKILCSPCSAELSWCDPTHRCRGCFAEEESLQWGLCAECKTVSAPLHAVGAAFDRLGPASSLLSALAIEPTRPLLRAMASAIVAQLIQFNWPIPDSIVALRRSPIRRWIGGKEPAIQLAKEVANQLGRPLITPIRSEEGALPQRALPYSQRKEERRERLFLSKREGGDQILLIVDDLIVTGATMREAARALQAVGPKKIYAMALCKH